MWSYVVKNSWLDQMEGPQGKNMQPSYKQAIPLPLWHTGGWCPGDGAISCVLYLHSILCNMHVAVQPPGKTFHYFISSGMYGHLALGLSPTQTMYHSWLHCAQRVSQSQREEEGPVQGWMILVWPKLKLYTFTNKKSCSIYSHHTVFYTPRSI